MVIAVAATRHFDGITHSSEIFFAKGENLARDSLHLLAASQRRNRPRQSPTLEKAVGELSGVKCRITPEGEKTMYCSSCGKSVTWG
jgi:hypothetical protein